MAKTFRTRSGIDKHYATEYNKLYEDVEACKIPSQELLPRLDKLFKECQEAFEKLPGEQKEGGFTRISLALAKQMIGKSEKEQLKIFDDMQNKEIVKRAQELNIISTGWNDLSVNEMRGVHIICNLYAMHNYKNNYKDRYLAVTPNEIYKAAGLVKHNYKGISAYESNDQKRIRQSLNKLLNKIVVSIYRTRNPETGEFNTIEENSGIIENIKYLYTEPWQPEPDKIDKNAKLKYIAIAPCGVFLSEVDNYFNLLPYNLYPELREAGYSRDIHLQHFIYWLAMITALRIRKGITNFNIEIGIEKLEIRLQMNNLIKAYRKKAADRFLKQTLERAKALGYLNEYEIIEGMIHLSMNEKKFKTPSRIIDVIKPKEVKTAKPKTKRFVFDNDNNSCMEIPINAPLPEGYEEEFITY